MYEECELVGALDCAATSFDITDPSEELDFVGSEALCFGR